MNKITLKNVVWKEGKNYVSWNLNTGISSFGDTKKEALESLQEALELEEDITWNKIAERRDCSSARFVPYQKA